MNKRNVTDGKDEDLSGEPEMIKAYRDTWELGIHSYLSYLRDRLNIAKELLSESGSCFVQISDENVHLVRSIMDEVFGSENFFALINYKSMSPLSQSGLAKVYDYIIWYTKDAEKAKFRPLYLNQDITNDKEHRFIDYKNELGYKKLSEEEFNSLSKDEMAKIFRRSVLTSSGFTPSCMFEFDFKGHLCKPFGNKSWRTTKDGIKRLIEKQRIFILGKSPYFKQYHSDFPLIQLDNSWSDTAFAQGRSYVVQTGPKVIQRCILMTTDPGDLVLDPTCGSGTTAFVSEQWGRRWITIDTSRIALNIAKQRLTTASFPYYKLYDEQHGDIRQGFKYRTVPHITLKSLANDEPPSTETLYDQPEEDKKRLRVSGPFTVETLQNYEPISPDELDKTNKDSEEEGAFEEVIKQHLVSAGIKNGRKKEQVIFNRVELLASEVLHAEGFYSTDEGEQKAYLHIGPKFGTVSKQQVNDAVKECRQRGDAQWLIILGFSFESDITGGQITTSLGSFEVTRCRMHDDLLQEGLKKKPAKSAASFVTIGEPDVELIKDGKEYYVEIQGLDIYDPIKDEVKARNLHDIAYWMVDDDYDDSNFVVKQVFFCGGDKKEFDKWRKGLDSLAKEKTKRNAEKTLKIEIDDEAFDRLYGYQSHPIAAKKGQKIAVRIISQFGEESTKVLTV